jgi:predicted dehydrogenase
VGDPHRVGIVGLGVISRAYLDTLGNHPAVRVTAVADLDTTRSAAVAAEFPGAEAVSVERLLGGADVDTVLNLTVPAVHAEIALRAIDAGKNVFVEKPLAVTFPDGRAIIDRAAADGSAHARQAPSTCGVR